MAGDKGNGRVTVAKIGEKLDNLTNLVQEVRNAQREQSHDINALQKEDVALHGRIDREHDRISVWTLGQGALTLVASSIAAVLGTRR